VSGVLSVGQFVNLCAERHLGVVGVVVQDVILDLVVIDEAELAVRTVPWLVAHELIIAVTVLNE
jgi:hypothetical protein